MSPRSRRNVVLLVAASVLAVFAVIAVHGWVGRHPFLSVLAIGLAGGVFLRPLFDKSRPRLVVWKAQLLAHYKRLRAAQARKAVAEGSVAIVAADGEFDLVTSLQALYDRARQVTPSDGKDASSFRYVITSLDAALKRATRWRDGVAEPSRPTTLAQVIAAPVTTGSSLTRLRLGDATADVQVAAENAA